MKVVPLPYLILRKLRSEDSDNKTKSFHGSTDKQKVAVTKKNYNPRLLCKRQETIQHIVTTIAVLLFL